MSPALQWLIGILTVLMAAAGSLVTWLKFQRSTSGEPSKTTADKLWEKLENFTDDLQEDLTATKQELRATNARLTHALEEWDLCKRKCNTVMQQVTACEQREERLIKRLQAAGLNVE